MDNLDIRMPAGVKIAVVGDIHESIIQFNLLLKRLQPNDKLWFVSCGDLIDKGSGIESASKIAAKLRELHEAGHSYTILGNHEMKRINRPDQYCEDDNVRWLLTRPLALSFRFPNHTRLTVVHGGISAKHKWKDLENNTDILYIRTLDEEGDYIPLRWRKIDGRKQLQPERKGVVWHEMYDGRFGYVASGHNAQTDGRPKFYRYSCNLDSCVYNTGVLTAQIFSENGRERMVQVVGPALRRNIKR